MIKFVKHLGAFWVLPVSIGLTMLLLGLSGCGFTGTGDAATTFAKTKGAEAYDRGLGNAEFFVCRAASVGSVIRRYGQTPQKAAAWRELCSGEDANVEALLTD